MGREVAQHVVRLRLTNGTWVTLGAKEAPGIVAEGLSLTSDLHGSQAASFIIRRPADLPWGELLAATQMRVEAAGKRVWAGRINQTPSAGKGIASQLSVQAQGWQGQLDDDQLNLYWVARGLSGFQDFRNAVVAPANYANIETGGQVQTGGPGGAITIGWPQGAQVPNSATTSRHLGVMLDIGAGRVLNRVAVTLRRISGANPDVHVFVRGASNQQVFGAAGTEEDIYTIALPSLPTPQSPIATFANTNLRYLAVGMYYSGTGGTFAEDNMLRLESAICWAQPGYDDGNLGSQLHASDVMGTVAVSGAMPLLSNDTSLVAATSFAIPAFAPAGYQTPRQILDAANAFHDYLYGVDVNQRLFFQPKPTAAAYEVGAWSGDDFGDASLANLDQLYNQVLVQYTAADGSSQVQPVTAVNNILAAQGITRTYVLNVGATLDAASAAQIGALWLANHATAPLGGSLTVRYGDVRTVPGGQAVHPSQLLLATGQRLRLANRIDPNTGAQGRIGTIVQVSYDATSEAATVTLDNTTSRFEAVIARLAAIKRAA